MPIYQYNGPTPNERKKFTLDGNGGSVELYPDHVSDPYDYVMEDGGQVQQRTFEVGEHVAAVDNPDPANFTEVT